MSNSKYVWQYSTQIHFIKNAKKSKIENNMRGKKSTFNASTWAKCLSIVLSKDSKGNLSFDHTLKSPNLKTK